MAWEYTNKHRFRFKVGDEVIDSEHGERLGKIVAVEGPTQAFAKNAVRRVTLESPDGQKWETDFDAIMTKKGFKRF